MLRCYADARSRFSVRRMNAVYKAMNLTYPYWQRIGFILSTTRQRKKAMVWRELFGEPVFEFYLDRPYRSDWILDDEWRVYYPSSLLV